MDRMVQARRSRTFRRSGRLDWGLLTGLIGVLFLRAFERGERVHAAMIARRLGRDDPLARLKAEKEDTPVPSAPNRTSPDDDRCTSLPVPAVRVCDLSYRYPTAGSRCVGPS